MYYVMCVPAPSLHRESTNSLIQVMVISAFILALLAMKVYFEYLVPCDRLQYRELKRKKLQEK